MPRKRSDNVCLSVVVRHALGLARSMICGDLWKLSIAKGGLVREATNNPPFVSVLFVRVVSLIEGSKWRPLAPILIKACMYGLALYAGIVCM